MKKWIVLLLILGCVVVTVGATLYANTMREQALDALNTAAEADSARQVEVAALGDSVNAYQRLVVQREVELDSIDRELQERPVIRLPGEIVLDTIWMPPDTVWAETPVEQDRQDYDFSGVDGPFGYDGSAFIWPLERRGVFEVSVHQREPVAIGVRVGCVQQGSVKAASVLFTADDPFNLIPGEVQQDPEICNPTPGFSFLPQLSLKGVGWELVKGAGWMLLANFLDDGVRKARY